MGTQDIMLRNLLAWPCTFSLITALIVMDLRLHRIPFPILFWDFQFVHPFPLPPVKNKSNTVTECIITRIISEEENKMKSQGWVQIKTQLCTWCSMARDVLSASSWRPVTCCCSSCAKDLYWSSSISFAASTACVKDWFEFSVNSNSKIIQQPFANF